MARSVFRVAALVSLVLCLLTATATAWSFRRAIRLEYAFKGMLRDAVVDRGRLWLTNKPHRLSEEAELAVLSRKLGALGKESNDRYEELRALIGRNRGRDWQNSPEMQRVNDVQTRSRVVSSTWLAIRASASPPEEKIYPLRPAIQATAALPLLYAFYALTLRRLRGQALAAKNICPECRYDIRVTPGRCPECGWTTPTPAAPASILNECSTQS